MELFEYVVRGRRLVPVPVRGLGHTPLVDVARRPAAIGIIVALGIAWFAIRQGPDPAPKQTIPTAQRGSNPSNRIETPKPLAASPQADAPDENLHVWLRQLNRPRFTLHIPLPPFADVWPTGDDRWDAEVWADMDTPAALQRLATSNDPFKGRAGENFLSVAEADGVLPVGELYTPEDALLAIYASWTEAEVKLARDWRSYEGRHVPPGERFWTLSKEAQREIERQYGHPEQDLELLRSTAEYAFSEWPDPPVAEHALLALVRAEAPKGVLPWRGEVMAERITQIEDPLIQEKAALIATSYGNRSSSPVPVSLLDAVYGVNAATHVNQLRLDAWGLKSAMFLEEWTLAARWSQRLEATLSEACDVEVADVFSHCDSRKYDLRDARSRLVALGLVDPSTWKEAVSAAAWTCHLKTPQRGSSRAQADWTGLRWQFGPWDLDTPTTSCLSQMEVSTVTPSAPIRVRITLEGR